MLLAQSEEANLARIEFILYSRIEVKNMQTFMVGAEGSTGM